MRRITLALVTTLVGVPLSAAPFAASAQEDHSAKEMKGPPNANGYGKEKMGDTVVKDDKAASGKDMKGPPNADGYKKDQ